MKRAFSFERPFDSAIFRFAKSCSAQGDILSITLFISFASVFFFISECQAQTAGKYEFYRYQQSNAVAIDPLCDILGRMSVQYEQRLDPNFSRMYEFVYQRRLEDRHSSNWYPESGISIGAIERIYLIDNGALLGGYCGVGVGAGMVNQTIDVRMTAEIGYKICFGGGSGHYFIEPRVLMDAYLITNHDGQRVLPYISLPFGYAWW